MRTKRMAMTIALFSILAGPAVSQAGVLVPNDSPKQPLRLRKEQISVRISNQVLQARVNQVFENQTDKEVEYDQGQDD